MEREVRGDVLQGYFRYVRHTWGSVGEEDCIEKTGVDPRKLKPANWYTVEHEKAIMNWILEEKGAAYITKCGQHTIKNLGLLSYAVDHDDVMTIIKNFPLTYHEGYNFGEVEIVELKDNMALIKMSNHIENPNTCILWWGAMNGVLEMTGTKGTVLETQCENSGAEYCLFEVRWE